MSCEKWEIKQGTKVDDLLAWRDPDGILYDVSAMTLTVKLAKLGDKTELESHLITGVSETVDGIEFNIGMVFVSALPADTYQAELHIQTGSELIVEQLPNLKITPVINV